MAPPVEQIVEVAGVHSWTARQGGGPPLVQLHGGPLRSLTLACLSFPEPVTCPGSSSRT
jgi:hypothetical protein